VSAAATLPAPRTRFALPPGAEAHEPPEHRGVARDGVRLLVAGPGGIVHRRFADLPCALSPGDLVVVNTSATVPAAVDGAGPDGTAAPVHVATPLDDGRWVVEVRRADGGGPDLGRRPGERIALPGRVTLTLEAPYPDPGAPPGRLWTAHARPPVTALGYLARHGRPIGYRHLTGRFPLADHQTVYATQPGSAEMPSAGRPFTDALVTELVTRGVLVAPLVLHAGVSSPERDEPPFPERFRVPAETARLVGAVRGWRGRVIAVGTTVVRALETVALPGGAVRAGEGWTSLVVTPERGLRVVDGLITGWHEPESSHLLMLEAAAGRELLQRSYDEAAARGLEGHEFGDALLILPS
jgi:S-adenosylmethionine:tRNA ribosyltransferase-isomerase